MSDVVVMARSTKSNVGFSWTFGISMGGVHHTCLRVLYCAHVACVDFSWKIVLDAYLVGLRVTSTSPPVSGTIPVPGVGVRE
jgi:hypothetical protein